MADLALYPLTQATRTRFESSGLSTREVARTLGTSPTQLYRLLDPTNYAKSLRQLMALLYLLGCNVDVEVKERQGRAASRSQQKAGDLTVAATAIRPSPDTGHNLFGHAHRRCGCPNWRLRIGFQFASTRSRPTERVRSPEYGTSVIRAIVTPACALRHAEVICGSIQSELAALVASSSNDPSLSARAVSSM